MDPQKFLGREIGSATIIDELEEGAMSMVFLAFQKKLRRRVAVKILPKSKDISEDTKEMFNLEAIVVAGFSHPNIVPIFEIGETDDCFFQVIQIVNGSNLNSIIKNHLKNPLPHKRIMPIADSITLTLGTLAGLAYAHDQDVIHQDIKPDNILIEENSNRPMIADFGIAKTAQSKKQTDYVVGSPLYIAPERLKDQNVDCRSDIYSVGLVLYTMAAGVLPLSKREVMAVLKIKMKDPSLMFSKSPSKASPVIDNQLESIILKAISANPDDRYQDCREFINVLKEYRRDLE